MVKNVSGYDLMKLHFGGMGSLGVIVAASFKVFPRPLHDVTVEKLSDSIEEAWDASARAMELPLPPAALELFSDGRVLARFFGSPDAVNRMVTELGWKQADASVWGEHSRRAPESWARIAVPRNELRGVLSRLPSGARWWASPGIGIAYWTFDGGPEDVRGVRAAAEAAHGSLVLMSADLDVVAELGAWGTPRPTLELMRRIKRAFDPQGILNPGRFVV